jgi:hypothetical protein
MSFGAGHIMDMINKVKQNRDLRTSNRRKFKNQNREIIYKNSEKNLAVPKYKTLPKAELDELKKQIKAKSKRNNKIDVIIFLLFFLIVFAVLIWVVVLM